MFKPKIFTTLKNYSWDQFRKDLAAGAIVGVVALPLAIAFAIASGVEPHRGLVTAVVAGFLISALGGSRVQIGGPTGAFVVIVYAIVQKHGLDGLILATLMGGGILVVMGFARFGGVIKFIPYPVTIGFTAGIAVVIFTSQIRDLLGLQMEDVPAEFLMKWPAFFAALPSLNIWALALSVLTVLIIVLMQKWTLRVPGTLAALVVTTLLVYYGHLPVETIGSRFGELPHGFPAPHWPQWSFSMVPELIRPATTIAILAGIESLFSAVVADGMIGGKHRSNMELVAQGIANIASALFGGMPATNGDLAHGNFFTPTIFSSGGRTPVAGIVHALTLLIILLGFGKLAAMIPLACLAGILAVVSYRMGEWHSVAAVFRAPRSDIIVMLTTFLLTVLIDLTVAIEIGMVLAAFLLIRRLALTSNINVITREFTDEEERDDPKAISKRVLPAGVEVFEITGPFFFGVAASFMEAMKNIERNPKVRIIRMRHVPMVDVTAANAMKDMLRECKKRGIVLLLSGVLEQPRRALDQFGLLEEIGPRNVLNDIDDALVRARELLA